MLQCRRHQLARAITARGQGIQLIMPQQLQARSQSHLDHGRPPAVDQPEVGLNLAPQRVLGRHGQPLAAISQEGIQGAIAAISYGQLLQPGRQPRLAQTPLDSRAGLGCRQALLERARGDEDSWRPPIVHWQITFQTL